MLEVNFDDPFSVILPDSKCFSRHLLEKAMLARGRILFLYVLVLSGQWRVDIDMLNHTTKNGVIFKVAITREWKLKKILDYKISFFHELSWLTLEVLVKLSVPQYCQLYNTVLQILAMLLLLIENYLVWTELCLSKCISWSSSPPVWLIWK